MGERRLTNIRLFGVIFACLILGIAFSVNLTIGLVAFFILSIFAIIAFRHEGKRLLIPIVIITYLVGFVYSYLLIANENKPRIDMTENGYISGIVDVSSRHELDGKAEGLFVLNNVTFNGERVDGKVLLYARETVAMLGDRIDYYGSMEHRELVVNSLGSTANYNDDNRYISKANRVDNIVPKGLGFRDQLIFDTEVVLFTMTDEDTAGFLMGLLFGDTSMLGTNVRIASRRLGIAHLFAVSGLHVGMIVGFMVMILNRLKVNKRYHLLILPLLIFYAYICGFSVSVLRATIMATLYLLSNALFMRYDMVSSISLAGIIILLICPMYLFDVSFVMSFLAVISIALYSDRLLKLFTRHSTKYLGIKRVLSANISVNIGLLPIMLYLFGGMSLLTVPANMLILPIVTLTFPIFYALFVLVMVTHLVAIVPIIVLPFKALVIVSKWLQGASFVGVYIDVNIVFVIAYIVVMILASKLVFINAKVKLVPRVVLVTMVMLSIIVPPISSTIKGKEIHLDRLYQGYTAIYRDEDNRHTLAILGKVDNYIMDKAVANVDRHGVRDIDTLVIPIIDEEDIPVIEEYNKSIGARYLVTGSDVFVKGLKVVPTHGYTMIGEAKNVYIEAEGNLILMIRPYRVSVPYGYYDLVVSHSDKMVDRLDTAKHYINFAKDSHSEINSGFTFYIKNGKIIPYQGVFN